VSLAEETKRILFRHDWPGNVRELKNVIDYAVLVARQSQIRPCDLPATLKSREDGERSGESLSLKERTLRFEKKLILDALHSARGVRKVAARMLGVDPRNFNYFLRKHNIE
jgi:DNA-binding NtrC family response regulator